MTKKVSDGKEMKQILMLTLLCAAGCMARPLYLLADPNDCIQQFYEPPEWATDPNLILGVILPAVVGPNTLSYESPTGKLNRVMAACDPDGHPFAITCHTDGWTASWDALTGYWTLSGDVRPGPNYVYVSATDEPGPYIEPETSEFTVLVWGLPPLNHAPVLH